MLALLLAASAAWGARWIVPADTPTGFAVIEADVRPQTAAGWAYRDRPVRLPPVEVPSPLQAAAARANPDLDPDNGQELRAHAANRIAELHVLGLNGEGVVVAVLDTGLAASASRVAVSGTWPAAGSADRYGHGTAVCGVIAGVPGSAAAKYVGLAPGTDLLIGKVLGDDGSGFESDVIAGLNWAAEQGTQVVNLSLGSTPSDEPDPLELACEALVRKGIIVVCAAGNAGYGYPLGEDVPYQIGSPACSALVTCVGSVSGDDRLSGFSSCGPSVRGHPAPDFVAFGHIVPLAFGEGTTMLREATLCGTSGYRPASGTSFACPYVAGLAALWLSAGGAAADFERVFGETCTQNVGQLPTGVEKANACGAGVLRAYDAFERAGLLPQPPEPPTPGDGHGCGGVGKAVWGVLVLVVICRAGARRRRRQ